MVRVCNIIKLFLFKLQSFFGLCLKQSTYFHQLSEHFGVVKNYVGFAENKARTYLQLPLRQWGAGNVYLLVLSS
jgi:hypothetical protein